MRHNRPALLITTLLAVTLACGLPGALSPTTAGGSSAGTSSETPASSIATPSGEPDSLEPLPPAGLIEAIQAGVEAGVWSYGEGLIQGLSLFTGEVQPEDAFREAPAFLEGFGLVREAQRYAREGEDQALRQEIAERLDRLGPTSDRLLEYAEPAPTSWIRPKVASLGSAPEDCASLFGSYSQAGFPPGSGIKCLLYKEGGIGGQTARAYWPIAYQQHGLCRRRSHGRPSGLAGVAKLQPAGPAQMKGVDLLFMILPGGGPRKSSPWFRRRARTTAVDHGYLGAIQANEQKQATDDDYGYFLQTVAHEMFHCFQVWNSPALADDAWSVQDWWGEGTAEYFSNVVYPSVDDEWRWMTEWLGNTATDSILEESYANFGFFQYVGNKLGDNGVLSMINHMTPAVGGDEDTQAAHWRRSRTSEFSSPSMPRLRGWQDRRHFEEDLTPLRLRDPSGVSDRRVESRHPQPGCTPFTLIRTAHLRTRLRIQTYVDGPGRRRRAHKSADRGRWDVGRSPGERQAGLRPHGVLSRDDDDPAGLRAVQAPPGCGDG
jgi:hypothetical protein